MSEDLHPTQARPDPIARLVGHPPRRIPIGPDTRASDVAPLLAEFRELVQAHDCPTAELQLDLLIASCRALSQEVGVLDAEIAALTAEVVRLTAVALHQERTIARLRVAGGAGPRTALERVVGALQALPRNQGGWAISDSPLPGGDWGGRD